MVIQVVDF